MRRLGGIAGAACTLALGTLWVVAGAIAGAAPAESRGAVSHAAAPAQPALWRTYDMIVDLNDLPRTYTCDQLWYEFHGILLRLGAPLASLDILPYQCSPSPTGDMKSPKVQVRFQLPAIVRGAAVKWAPIKAVERTIRLAPGEPKTLESDDCRLMQQISQTLLGSIPVRVDAAHFDCSAPSTRAVRFNVTLTGPVAQQGPVAATTAAPAPR